MRSNSQATILVLAVMLLPLQIISPVTAIVGVERAVLANDINPAYSIVSRPAIAADGTLYVGCWGDNFLYAINPDGTEKWRCATPEATFSTPTLRADGALLLCAGSSLCAISSAGKMMWRFSTGWYTHRNSPVISADGAIYIGSCDSHVYAVNQDGTEKWRFKADGEVEHSPILGEDGTIYVTTWGEHLFAINPDGTEKWRFRIKDDWRPAPQLALTSHSVYAASYRSAVLYAVSLDGTEKWGIDIQEEWATGPVLAPDGTVYLASTDGYLFAINPDGYVKWGIRAGSEWASGPMGDTAPVVAADGTVYAVSGDGCYCAVDEHGKEKWRFDIEGDRFFAPVLCPDGTVYAASSSGVLCAVDTDGSEAWRYETGGEAYFAPVLGTDGTVYFGSLDGHLYALNESGDLMWTYATGGDVSSSPSDLL